MVGSVDRGGMIGSRGGVVGGRVHNRSMVDYRGVVDNRGMIGSGSRGVIGSRGGCVIGSRGGSVIRSWLVLNRVVGDSLVLYVGDETVIVISMILDVLGPAVREQDGITAFNVAGGVSNLSSIEIGSTVLIVDSVLVTVWLGFLFVLYRVVICGGGGMMDNRGGMIGGGSRVVGSRGVGEDSRAGESHCKS